MDRVCAEEMDNHNSADATRVSCEFVTVFALICSHTIRTSDRDMANHSSVARWLTPAPRSIRNPLIRRDPRRIP
jgi:hypothetical protein